MSPFAVERIKKNGWSVTIEKNVSEILTENDFPLDKINAIVWSHHHWDHQGRPALFPKSTELVVGPGFKKQYTPGWPTGHDSALREDDWEGRSFREVDVEKEGKQLKIGRFWAYDYFGDGSFYLLDTPGHTVGHLCALARTTSGPDSFLLLGGDACHRESSALSTPSVSANTFNFRRRRVQAIILPSPAGTDYAKHGREDRVSLSWRSVSGRTPTQEG